MKKSILFIFFVFFSASSYSQSDVRVDSFFVKYRGTALLSVDSMLIYSKPDKFKIVEYVKTEGSNSLKLTYLLGQELTIINEVDGKKVGTRIPIIQSHDEFKNGIQFLSLQNYKDYSKLIGNESLLGYQCSIYENEVGNKIWVASDTYVLKVQNNVENIETIAYEFDLNATIPDKLFEVPADAEIQ